MEKNSFSLLAAVLWNSLFYAADFVKLDDQAWNGELRS